MAANMLLTVLHGAPDTLVLTAASLGVGVLGAVPLVVVRRSGPALTRGLARIVIDLLRGIPPIVWLFIIFFGLPDTAINLTPTTAAIIGLGAVSCAYIAEIYRGGLAAIHKGQWEGAQALGMSRTLALSRVVGPQVLRVSVPAIASYGISLLKDSSVAYTIGVGEILFYANNVATTTREAVTPFLAAAAVYIALSVVCGWAARSVDARLRRRIAR